MRIALIGYGKMGKAIEEIALERGHQISVKITRENANDIAKISSSNTDVAIEFTSPHAALSNLTQCFKAKVAVVCGSTGWTKDLEQAKKLASDNDTGFIYASNFSIGVNLFFELNKKLAELMKPRKEYDVLIEETHHTQKKDAPSGTAITIAEQVMAITGRSAWKNEMTNDPDLVPIISHRIDPAPGTHNVKYSSSIDDIEIRHTAHNRKGFAGGAVLAAEFLSGKKGFYTMKDVLAL